MGTFTLEDVAGASADPGTLMFQLYVLKDRDFTRDIVQVSWTSSLVMSLQQLHKNKVLMFVV